MWRALIKNRRNKVRRKLSKRIDAGLNYLRCEALCRHPRPDFDCFGLKRLIDFKCNGRPLEILNGCVDFVCNLYRSYPRQETRHLVRIQSLEAPQARQLISSDTGRFIVLEPYVLALDGSEKLLDPRPPAV